MSQTDQKVYKVMWQSAIDSDPSRLREDEFVGIEAVARFIDSLERSRHRTFVRCLPKLTDD